MSEKDPDPSHEDTEAATNDINMAMKMSEHVSDPDQSQEDANISVDNDDGIMPIKCEPELYDYHAADDTLEQEQEDYQCARNTMEVQEPSDNGTGTGESAIKGTARSSVTKPQQFFHVGFNF